MAIEPDEPPATPTSLSSLTINRNLLDKLKLAYNDDPWCKKLKSAEQGMANVTHKDGLWFVNDRLVVPAKSGLREDIFRLAHDTLGHFGFYKTYKAIKDSFFWPGMRKDLEGAVAGRGM